MYYKLIRLTVLIIFLCSGSDIYGQIYLNQTKIESGIGSRMVSCIIQDSIGFMWFGTDEGLFRFDGYDFIQYKNNTSDDLSLSDNYIHCLLIDNKNNLWVGTQNGLNQMNLSKPGVFYKYFKDSLNENKIVDNDIRAMLLDKFGYIWIGTYNNGISRISFDKSNQTFIENFAFKNNNVNPPPTPTITAIANNKTNRLFFGTFGSGLAEYLPEQNQFVNYHINKNDSKNEFIRFITDIKIENDKLWLSTYKSGVTRINLSDLSKNNSQKFIKTKLYHYNSDINSTGSLNSINTIMPVVAFHQERTPGLLFGTNRSGLFYLNTEKMSLHKIKQEKSYNYDFENDRVFSIYQDMNDNIWVGSTDGLSLINNFNPDIVHIKNEANNPNSLSSNNITSLLFDKNNSLWIGTENGLNFYDIKSDLNTGSVHIKRFTNQQAGRYISDIYLDNQNNLLFGTYGHGLWMVKELSDQTYNLLPVAKEALNKSNQVIRFITKILQDKHNRLWIGSLEGLLIVQKVFNQNYTISNEINNEIPKIRQIINLYEDIDGNIWICTYGNGLFYIKFKKDSILDVKHFNSRNGLSNDKVLSIAQDLSGFYWIGTSSGLNRLDIKTGKIRKFFEEDGLSNAFIYGILIDDNGSLWISTNYGLSKCKNSGDENYIFQNFFKKDGLQENEFNVRAYSKGNEGIMAFGGINGVNIFDPSTFKIMNNKPPTVLTRFTVFNEDIKLDSALYEKKHISLDYKQNLFTIVFAALEYNTPEKIRYLYQMEGFDADWINNGNRRYVTFTNLDPGEYTFRVKTSNSEEEARDKSTDLHITIAPPYWQTWWFRILIILVFATILWNIHRYRIDRLLEMERLRIQIASDLHDEIGSSLSKISMYSDLASKPIHESERNPLLSKIGNTSRELVKTMSDVVWSVDARNDYWGGLIDRIRDTASDILNAKNISFNFDVNNIDLEQKISALVRQNIYLILKEAVTNIAKHSGATHTSINFENLKDTIIITIHDNGMGINDMKKQSGNGLKNMRLRAKRIIGKLEISNNNGTVIKIILNKK